MFAHLIQDPKNYVENPARPPEVDAYGQLTKLASTFSDVDGLFQSRKEDRPVPDQRLGEVQLGLDEDN